MSDFTQSKTINILSGAGMALLVPGAMALVSIPIPLIFNEKGSLAGLVITALLCLGIGAASYKVYDKDSEMPLTKLMVMISLGWMLVALAVSIPFVQHGIHYGQLSDSPPDVTRFSDFTNALFESVSGITSTGLSMVQQESTLTRTLQWWRSLSQWVGAIGFVVLVAFFHNPDSNTIGKQFEHDTLTRAVAAPGINFYKFWWIYLLLTVLAISIYLFNGLSLWQAVNHGLTGIATGGFTVTDDSFTDYPAKVRLATIAIMVLGSLSFYLYYLLLRHGRFRRFFTDRQNIVYASLMLVGIMAIGSLNQNAGISWLDSSFQFTSALGTAGFQSNKLDQWPMFSMLVLTIVMLIGGTSNSTTGGIKIFRFWFMLKGLFFELGKLMFSPESTTISKHDQNNTENEKLHQDARVTVYLFILGWVVVYVVFTLIFAYLLADEYTLQQILFESASAFGNVGLSSGITGPDMLPIAKVLMIVLMYLGRLELLPLLVLTGWLSGSGTSANTKIP
ncbi:MAG: TrkH family potassium uptake protein [Cyclobacteriaceae bacterium]|nr:TrkH family potassium uptake protein [Cyclobacteriaceae bacterium]